LIVSARYALSIDLIVAQRNPVCRATAEIGMWRQSPEISRA
jgi:hypothetical protein